MSTLNNAADININTNLSINSLTAAAQVSANNFVSGYATTATAAATTTLSVASKQQQYFTGSTTQTVLLPVVSTLVLGQQFNIVNQSTGAVTVQSSGLNTVQVMAANTSLTVTCILVTGTTAASWATEYLSTAVTAPISTNIVNGRLTLTSGSPVTTGDVTAAGTIYFSPYMGNTITIYNGSVWVQYAFAETALTVPAVANQMYDVFGQISGGVLALVAVAWTSDTARATALVLQNGVYCESGVLTNLYLGSFRTKTASQCNDSVLFRHVWNYYNRITKQMKVSDATATWTYSTNTLRQANANAANQIDFVQGVQEDAIVARVSVSAFGTVATSSAIVSIGINSTSASSASITAGGIPGVSVVGPLTADYAGYPGLGRTFMPWLEAASGTTITWEGTSGNFLSGISGSGRF